MKKLSFLSLSSVLLATASAYALDCATPPSCSDLGYTKTAADCEGKNTLKCFFDTSLMYCLGEETTTDTDTDTSTAATVKICEVGDIIFTDDQCYVDDKGPEDQDPFAVVIYTGEHRFALIPERRTASWTSSMYVTKSTAYPSGNDISDCAEDEEDATKPAYPYTNTTIVSGYDWQNKTVIEECAAQVMDGALSECVNNYTDGFLPTTSELAAAWDVIHDNDGNILERYQTLAGSDGFPRNNYVTIEPSGNLILERVWSIEACRRNSSLAEVVPFAVGGRARAAIYSGNGTSNFNSSSLSLPFFCGYRYPEGN